VDAAASGRTKQLLHDTNKALWSLIELLSDSHTIVALAEVTATLCHTLEMEDAIHRQQLSRIRKAQRRHERNDFTRQAYTERELIQNLGVSPEEAILSGLGTEEENLKGTLPCELSSKIFEPTDQTLTSEPTLERDWERTQSECMKEAILRRGDHLTRISIPVDNDIGVETHFVSHTSKSTNLASNGDMEDLVAEAVVSENSEQSSKEPSLQIQYNDHERGKGKSVLSSKSSFSNLHASTRSLRLSQEKCERYVDAAPEQFVEPESSVAQFYNTLDKILATRRAESLKDIVIGPKLRNDMNADEKESNTLKHAITAVKALNLISKSGSKNEKASIQGRLVALRRAALEEDQNAIEELINVGDKTLRSRKRRIPLVIPLIISVILAVWVGLGFYGLYALIWPRFIRSQSQTKMPPEITIRILKEVAYVHQKNLDLTTQSVDEDITLFDDTKLQQCLLDALQ
jgi:hypothetical protein